jgi:peptidoglycan/xylan/chitin deacetylase (PgdA/CDA1 family)
MKPVKQPDQHDIPILITWDVDPDRWTTLDRRQESLMRAMDLCDEFGIHSTFFFTASFANEYPSQIARMQRNGHEIGCHGLTHTDEEDYDRMPEQMQRQYISSATEKLTELVGSPILTFRSPRVKTSACTLRLLGENGYQSDSSVCSQRMDLLSSNLINPGWIVAPRRPYHPHQDNAFKRGDLPIIELPVSALVFPFISGSLCVFGLRLMKAFFRLLYAESRRTGKPIIYLSHPVELIPSKRRKGSLSLKQFNPATIRTHGLVFRNLFFRMDGETWFHATHELFTFMASFPDVKFLTSRDYVRLPGFNP